MSYVSSGFHEDDHKVGLRATLAVCFEEKLREQEGWAGIQDFFASDKLHNLFANTNGIANYGSLMRLHMNIYRCPSLLILSSSLRSISVHSSNASLSTWFSTIIHLQEWTSLESLVEGLKPCQEYLCHYLPVVGRRCTNH